MNIKYILVHVSDSPQGRGDDAETIHRWHQEAPNNWDGLGYHYCIVEDGEVQAGRPEYWQGAHVRKFNHQSIGICLIGKASITEQQDDALFDLIRYDLSLKYPEAVVVGHRDLDDRKTCPNFDIAVWYSKRLLVAIGED